MSRENTRKWAIYLVLVLFLASLVVVSTYLIFYDADFHIKGDEVAVIHVQGVMLTGSVPAGIGIATSEDITASLRNANEDDRIRAVVIRVNSPGGSPAAAQEIIREIKKMDKPVVVSMGDVAASAAYHISAPADKILANPDTITGSIGVIWTFKNKTSFYEEEGVEHYIAKSGEFKDMGADWRGLTDAEKIYADKTILEVYDRFVTEVAQGRNLTKGEVRDIADGRIYTGTKAKKLGLVDELGNLYDAVDDAAKLADIEGTPVITYLNKPSIARILFGSEEAKRFTSYYTDNDYGQLVAIFQ
ncbi:MAG: Peptidase family S49 [Candidatus Argoarchaeum ethanivorans]|uniref:Peptidase family S49 n=1 Tax=Candidatus Argoarchaeum ethanivorans TaxID=2608793 RepID=A0A812A1M7_9EURY|nr:MAG: Peptidase family S49 [Candidatus Argoarchaeum ethanivorans]